MTVMERGFRDRDYIETEEGLVFAVIGNVHPVDRVIAYLKYMRIDVGVGSVNTIWFKQGVPYLRVLPLYSASNVRAVLDRYLRDRYRDYVVLDKYRNIELIEVPKHRVRIHYKPEERLQEVFKRPRDSLERLVLEMVEKLALTSEVSVSNFGVTGSILLGIHNPQYSDIDLIVYGTSNAYKVRESIKELYTDESSGFSYFDEDSLERWAREVAETQAFTVDEAKLFYRKYVWNRGLYRGRKFSIHPVKLEDEVREEWEQTIHKPLCIGTVRARVVDSRDSIFMPAVYVVRDVEILDGCRVNAEIRRVVSYESLYIDVAQPGDEIIARGKFEHVTDTKTGDEYAQVVVGSYEAQGKDFIRPVSLG
jgi:predicted nucleotidyltransferase